MRYPIIAALLLSGCAAQPTYSPAPTVPSADQVREACIDHIAKVLAFVEIGEPLLDQCLAGNSQKCGMFAVFIDRIQPQHDSQEASRCFESGSTFGGLAAMSNSKLPGFTRKLKLYNKKMGV